MSYEPEATRYTLGHAPGYKVSHFARGVMELQVHRQATTATTTSWAWLAENSGVSVPTLRRLLLGKGRFDVETLQAVAGAFGVENWNEVSALGMRASGLELPEGVDDA